MLESFRNRYGGSPLHLAAMIASLALAGYAGLELVKTLGPSTVVVWLAGAAVLHDLVLFPLYTLLDKGTTKVVGRRRAAFSTNYIRFPALMSGLLLLVYLPLIAGLSGATYEGITGLPVSVYFGRWLLITGVLFGTSGLLYALRFGVARPR